MQTVRQQAVVDNIARGLPDGFVLELLSPSDVAELESAVTTDIVGGALLAGEDQVNPMLLAEAYKRAALVAGARMQNDQLVDEILREGDRVVGVRVGDETIGCGHVINAAGAWAGQLAATADISLPVEPIRGQVVLTEALPPTLAACLSTSSCYLVQKRHGEILIGSTTEQAGFDTGITEEGLRGLCQGAIKAVPMLADVGIKRTWAGLRPGTPDEMPVLGGVDGIDGYANVAGGFRTGIVAAPLMARVAAQDIVDETPDVPIEPYLVDRFGNQ
jgi:hydrogen cyanide synthase HcnC